MDRNRSKFARPIRSTSTAAVSDSSGIYDNVKHKNRRRSSGGNRNGRSRSRSRVGHRNNAKGAHQSPKDRLFGRNAKGRQKSCKISTGVGRQPKAKNKRRSTKPSERTVDVPSDQSDTGTKTSSNYDSAKPRTSNTSTDRTRRQLHESVNEQSVLERLKKFYARRKVLCWVLLGFFVVAIVGVIILGTLLGIQKTTTTTTADGHTEEAPTTMSTTTSTTSTTSATTTMTTRATAITTTVTTITTPEPYRGKVRTISSACNAKLDQISCVFGSPPSTSSCFVGNCTTIMFFRGTETETVNIDRNARAEEGDQLCKFGGTLGLCSADGQCKPVPGLRDEPSWYEDAHWEDNCGLDYPPCYNVFTMRDPNANSIQAREDCRNQRPCKDGEANVVWTQYLRCKFGKNRTSTNHCKGVPVQFWMCHRCNRPIMKRVRATPKESCAIDQKPGEYLQDGEPCKHSQDVDGRREAYCYNKVCYFIDQEVSDTNKPMTYDDCMAKKLQDAKEMMGE